MTDYSEWTDQQLAIEAGEIQSEQQKRLTLLTAEAQMNTLQQVYLTASNVTPGDEWRQPTGGHDAYPKEWVVSHNGKQWVSTLSGNVWEPGVSGWREVVEEGGAPPAWAQPVGSHDAYATGDRVSHKGEVWASTSDNNVWEPGVYGWQVVPGEPVAARAAEEPVVEEPVVEEPVAEEPVAEGGE